MSIKDYIITALKDANKMLQKMSSHLMGWTNTIRGNNLEIQGIPSAVSIEILEDRVIEIFESMNISLAKNDIEDSQIGQIKPPKYNCPLKKMLCWFD